MNSTELRTLDDKGLLLRRQDLLGELTSLKFQGATGQLGNTAAVKTVRRALARVETIIREREQDQNMAKGGLANAVGKLDSEQSAFASFRKFMGNSKAE
jgi:large subunit ribosomal protein L29